MKIRISLFIILTITLIAPTTKGQTYYNPFSRFGPGELIKPTLSNQVGMGGIGIGGFNKNNFSFNNPSSYCAVNSFNFETGYNAKLYKIKADTIIYRNKDYQFPYMAFAAPLLTKKDVTKWALSVGLLPHSRVSYKGSTYSNTIINQDTLKVREIFEGAGGLNRTYLGTAFSPVKNLFLGLNLNYYFGKEDLIHRLEFPDSIPFYGVHKTSSHLIQGLQTDWGATYQFHFNSDTSIFQLGLSGSIGSNLNVRQDYEAYSYIKGYPQIAQDTLLKIEDTLGKLYMPGSIGVGFQWNKIFKTGDRLSEICLGLDYETNMWSNYSIFGQNDSLKNTSSYRVGLQWTPDLNNENKNYLNKIKYRAGFKSSQYFFNINGNIPTFKSITLGFGFPFTYLDQRTQSVVSHNLDLAVEFGQMGSLSINKQQQTFCLISLGIHLYEPDWFRKSKIY